MLEFRNQGAMVNGVKGVSQINNMEAVTSMCQVWCVRCMGFWYHLQGPVDLFLVVPILVRPLNFKERNVSNTIM